MKYQQLPGPVRIALAILLWSLILWLFTLGHAGFVPVARMIFLVFVMPYAIAEWLKMKNLLSGKKLDYARVALIVCAAVIWWLWLKK